MTLGDVLRELVQRLGSADDGAISWGQVRAWPEGALEAFLAAGWLKPMAPAVTVECPGCEENCFMPVHVLSAPDARLARAYVACDRRDDMGRVQIPSARLQQWQLTHGQVAEWVSRELGLKSKPERDKASGVFKLGGVRGNKRIAEIQFMVGERVCLVASGHELPLVEVVRLEKRELVMDRQAIQQFVDLPPALGDSNRYKPSMARREARKLDTKARHEAWQKEYRKLKRERPGMTDVWYSQQIAKKKDIAQGKSAATIRKNMTK